MEHRPKLKFDWKAGDKCYPDKCYPDTSTNENNGKCNTFDSNAPIYFKFAYCGNYMKLVWWFWYGWQKPCLGDLGKHGDDWEHITINFVKSGNLWVQDSVTWFQHDGWYTRSNLAQHPDVYIGKNSHGSYDNWCDGKGAIWQQDYCAGSCGYWDDFRNSKDAGWMPDNIKNLSDVTDNQVNRITGDKYFDNSKKNKCKGGDWRCVAGPCGCWRNNHMFAAPTHGAVKSKT
jgi:hypothetical protein